MKQSIFTHLSRLNLALSLGWSIYMWAYGVKLIHACIPTLVALVIHMFRSIVEDKINELKR